MDLTPSQLEELMARYYAGEKVSDLIAEFGLSISNSKITSIFPPEILDNLPCPYCNLPMTRARLARNASSYIVAQRNAPACNNCSHVAIDNCRCQNCTAQAEQRRLAKETEVREILAESIRPRRDNAIKIHELTLRDSIYLVSVVRAGQYEESPFIRCLDAYDYHVAPTLEYSIHIISTLYESGLIDLSPHTPPSHLLSSNYEEMSFHITRLEWQLDLAQSEDQSLQVFRRIEATLRDKSLWPEHWHSELLSIWIEIAEQESLWYLEAQLDDHGFSFHAGDKTRNVIRDILRDYSIAQIYNFVWTAVRDAAAYYLRSGVPRQRAANTVAGNCQRRAERAKSERWPIKSFRRDYRCPETTISSLFAYVVTSLGDEYFSTTPSENRLHPTIDFNNPTPPPSGN